MEHPGRIIRICAGSALLVAILFLPTGMSDFATSLDITITSALALMGIYVYIRTFRVSIGSFADNLAAGIMVILLVYQGWVLRELSGMR